MDTITRLFLSIVVTGMAMSPAATVAQDTKERWEEHSELVRARQNVDPLGSDLFGENVNYYSGGLSFTHTDVSIPGNSALPVTIARTYTATDMRNKRVRDLPFADWDLDLPYVEGIYAAQTGWVRSGSPSGQRCSLTTFGALEPPAFGTSEILISGSDYWNGLQMSLPGRGSQSLLLANSTSSSMMPPSSTQVPAPANGPWYWVTADYSHLGCLPSLQANASGEGFRAVTADGIKYRFDRMATTVEPTLEQRTHDPEGATISFSVDRRKVRLYATYVEDRFGNSVTYTYSNAPTQPVRLTGITSSDGRSISLSYNTYGHVASVTESGRTWTYAYATVAGKRTLTSVTLPDGSSWAISFGGLSSLNMKALPIPPGEPWTCINPRDVEQGQATGMLTHPSGAVGTFVVEPRLFGRSNVPVVCTDYKAPEYNIYGGDPVYPVHFYAPALISKTITGPGLTTAQWDYSYGGQFGFAPSIGTSWAVVEGPQGEWTRFTYDNAYQSSEGLQVSVERGGPIGALDRITTQYQITQSIQAYPPSLGKSSAPLGGDFPARA